MILSVDSNYQLDFEPISTQLNIAGRVEYKLGHYLASHFREIFSSIDNEKERYEIKQYSIRNMTLEQVFIAIGEEEIAKEITEDNSTSHIEVDRLIDEMPQLSEASSCNKFNTLLKSNFRTLW